MIFLKITFCGSATLCERSNTLCEREITLCEREITLCERRFGKRGNLSATCLLNIITYVMLLTIEDEVYGPLTYVILVAIEDEVYEPLTYGILFTI